MNESFLDALVHNQNLSLEEIVKKQEEFSTFSASDREFLWEKLHGYFKNASITTDQKYWWSYFRWYTELSWDPLINRDRDFIITIAFPRQIIMAVLLGFNVYKEFIWYLNVLPFKDEKEMGVFYSNVKDSFFKSAASVGIWKNRPFIISELVKETIIANQKRDSLQFAEILSKLHEILFPNNNPEIQQYVERFVCINAEDAVNTLLNIVNFFIGIEGEKIWYVVEGTIHDEKFRVIEEYEAQQNNRTPTSTVDVPSVVVPSSSLRPSNVEIRKMVEHSFPLDVGKVANFEGIIAMLDTLASRYGDDQIRELYVYNEKNSAFEWNEKLLS